MSRILVLSWDGGGNTPAAYNLGSRLVRAGHRVRMMGWHAMAARAAEAGLEFARYPSVPPWPADLRHEDGWQRIELALFGAETERDICSEARTFGADLVVTDCMLTAGYAAALRLHVPVVSVVHPLYAPFVRQWGSQVLGTDVAELLGRSAAVLALQPPGFDLPGTVPGNTTYVGAISPPGPARRLDATLTARLQEAGDPWVLLSMSTTLQGQREALPGLLKELASSPVRVLVTLGGVLAPESLDAPANVTVRGYLPHESVLPRVEAVVTHAGMSTVATVLAAGRPMVCVPQGREQPLNAARVAEVGAGLDVAPEAVETDLAAAVLNVLSNPRFRSTAQEFAARSAELGYGQHAADLVESALGADVTFDNTRRIEAGSRGAGTATQDLASSAQTVPPSAASRGDSEDDIHRRAHTTMPDIDEGAPDERLPLSG